MHFWIHVSPLVSFAPLCISTIVAVSDVLFDTAIASRSVTFYFGQGMYFHSLRELQERRQIHPWMHAIIQILDFVNKLFLSLYHLGCQQV